MLLSYCAEGCKGYPNPVGDPTAGAEPVQQDDGLKDLLLAL